ncbi:MAG: indole-3-glycerol phosphate synthase TrpC [Candidatus Omnitrophica bacterium]|nr:indole-3-glycerol phosphate synthase TrpC [Candidatus Omnitrophota bacterium]
MKETKTMFLNEIIEHKKSLIEQKKKVLPLEILKTCKRPRNFCMMSIAQRIYHEGFGIIAETKKASPSGGLFRKRYSPKQIAISYQNAGACAISVLTEDKFFLGSIEHLKAVKSCVNIPVLAKDFFVDEYQVYQAYLAGADCILLILKILSDQDFLHLFKVARSLKLEVLAEIQNEKELSRFFNLLPQKDGMILGINSRNLSNLEIDFEGTFYLLSLLKGVKIPLIVESGISSAEQLTRFFSAGANGALIGSYLLRSKSPKKALRKLIKEIQNGR